MVLKKEKKREKERKKQLLKLRCGTVVKPERSEFISGLTTVGKHLIQWMSFFFIQLLMRCAFCQYIK